MKILIVTSLLAPYRVEWFDELGKKAKVTILYTKEKDIGREDSWVANTSKYCDLIKIRGINFKNHEICLNVITYLKDVSKYDIILFDGYGLITNLIGICYMKFKKRKYFVNVDGGIKKDKENCVKKALKRFALGKAYVLCSSESAMKYVVTYGACATKCYIHPFSSLHETDLLDSIPTIQKKIEKKHNLNIHELLIIISVGQFIYRKGYDLLLKACKDINKNVGVYIVGGVPTEEYLRMKEEMKLLNVHFEGFKTKEELAEYYIAADLFVLPTREDIWGLVINEAMAFGLPVITTDRCIAGLELIKDYENGFIVPVERADILAKRIEEVLSDEQLAIRMGKANLKKIRPYTIENMARQHINIFKKILILEERKCRTA